MSFLSLSNPGFSQNPQILIQYFYALMYATQEELGYDLSMTRALDENGEVQYRIKVDDKLYQTIKPLSDFKADVIQGRATRVWEVKEFVDNELVGEPRALKDFWLDAEAKTEKELWDELAEEAGKNEEDKAIFEKHFMKFVHGARVRDSRESDVFTVEVASTDIVTVRNVAMPLTERTQSRSLHGGSSHPESVGSTPALSSHYIKPLPVQKRIHRRSHQRSVFDRVCTVYHDLTDLLMMATVLRDTVKGNCLVYKLRKYTHTTCSAQVVMEVWVCPPGHQHRECVLG